MMLTRSNFPRELGAQIKALRKANGLTQAQLGAMIGVCQVRVATIERDPACVSLRQIWQLLSVLGVTLELSFRQPAPAQCLHQPDRSDRPSGFRLNKPISSL